MDKNIDKTVAEVLLKKGKISQELLDTVVKESERSGESLLRNLSRRGVIAEEEALKILSEELNIPCLDLKSFTVDRSVIEKVPVKFASYYRFFPLKIDSGCLTIAVSAPLAIKVQDELRLSLGFSVKMALARESDILDMLKIYYGLGAETVESMLLNRGPEKTAGQFEQENEKVEDIEKLAEDASVIKLVNQIILDAYKRRATDIHIEPFRDKIRVRYRIDGILYDANVPAEIKVFLKAILSRIKIMSNLNIVEHRMPQDGRAIVKVQDQNLDLRVSCIPAEFGESMVIRILPTVMLYDINKLGLDKEELNTFEMLINQPNGIIFVTGPTGSGKTTTLYAAINTINTSQRKVITIEDPIEYEINGVMQIQIMPEIGFDFPLALRSILRHDPDIVMVGEVRDLESAEIAVRIALTGHLVFSTLHTNDTASGIARLIDLGIEPYLVASSVKAFIAQRLIRVICPKCKEEDIGLSAEIKKKIAKELGLDSAAALKTYRGKGCHHCNLTGFYGRTAIYEILIIDKGIIDLLLKKSPSDDIKKLAIKSGMKTLRQDGWHKVLDGITTPEEIMNVTQEGNLLYSEEPAEPDKGAVSGFAYDKEKTLLNEKRLYMRLNKKIKIYHKSFNAAANPEENKRKIEQAAKTINLSAGGLMFFSDKPIAVNSILELTIELPNDDNTIVCLAKVLRSLESAEEPGRWEIGVCFLDMISIDRARLNKYIVAEVAYSPGD